MTIKCIDEMNVYFHMKNHYKKLGNVKSRINHSSPKGFNKSCSSSQSEKSFKIYNHKDRHEKVCPHLRHKTNTVKKHCIPSLEMKSDPSINSSISSVKSSTRRHHEMQHKLQQEEIIGKKYEPLPNKAQKNRHQKKEAELIKKEDRKNTEKEHSKDTDHEKECISNMDSTIKTDQKDIHCEQDNNTTSRAEEHEYLQFLLRITEDIIINNYFRNEDIERVFQYHIEANKERLNMDRMKDQILKLASELNISFKKNKNPKVNNCFKNSFENSLKDLNLQTPKNCECSSKRILEITNCHQSDNFIIGSEICEENSQEILENKYSLDRVTECTEPTNSIETVFHASSKYASVTTISSFGNVDVLPCFENISIGIEDLQNDFVNKNVLEEKFDVTDIPLTEKEQSECTEEEIVFDKLKKNVNPQEISTIITNNIQTTEYNLSYEKNDGVTNAENLPAFENQVEKSEILLSENLVAISSEKNKTLLSETLSAINIINDKTILSIENEQNNNVSSVEVDLSKQDSNETEDKYTQIEINYADKECNTNNDLNININAINELNINDITADNYVLINGPIYILREALNSKNKIILPDPDHSEIDFTPVKENNEDQLSENSFINKRYNISDYSLASVSESDSLYLKKTNYCKLLHSDYDLTPQRDSSSSKYHYLLVDACTSISNVNLNKTESNQNLLLISENYSLDNVLTSNEIIDNNSKEINTFYSSQDVPNDCNYKLMTYTAYNRPKQVQENLCGKLEQNMSLTNYEIENQNAISTGNIDNYELIKEIDDELEKM